MSRRGGFCISALRAAHTSFQLPPAKRCCSPPPSALLLHASPRNMCVACGKPGVTSTCCARCVSTCPVQRRRVFPIDLKWSSVKGRATVAPPSPKVKTVWMLANHDHLSPPLPHHTAPKTAQTANKHPKVVTSQHVALLREPAVRALWPPRFTDPRLSSSRVTAQCRASGQRQRRLRSCGANCGWRQ